MAAVSFKQVVRGLHKHGIKEILLNIVLDFSESGHIADAYLSPCD